MQRNYGFKVIQYSIFFVLLFFKYLFEEKQLVNKLFGTFLPIYLILLLKQFKMNSKTKDQEQKCSTSKVFDFDILQSYNKHNLTQIQSDVLIDDNNEPLLIIKNTIIDFAEKAKIETKLFIDLLINVS